MTTEPSLITLPTVDHGDVVLPEPAWCAGHAHHDPETERADLMHAGPVIECAPLGRPLLSAELVQSPFANTESRRLGGRTPGVSVWPLGLTLNATDLYSLAAELDTYADRLRTLADRLATVLDGDNR
ncbi:hypothetical protein NFX46_26735 [Streptomyces phaeoluteigriseus]|uniref:Uncharacterized protein n=1 Tax=Streptomyces phaeoluteigriseus TaxID=114686 RepID=A0ABY4ZDF4_9ACTN|nr:hypothetical protein [Streptomyces phaeoluteigriseus]USQ86996.1 hypothetical protein NFX46_26735 [Streptomyces phaeoluteigriseus]